MQNVVLRGGEMIGDKCHALAYTHLCYCAPQSLELTESYLLNERRCMFSHVLVHLFKTSANAPRGHTGEDVWFGRFFF